MGNDALTKSYVPPPQAIVQGSYKIKVLDMFSEFLFLVQCLHTDYSRELYDNNWTYCWRCICHNCHYSPWIRTLCPLFTNCCLLNLSPWILSSVTQLQPKSLNTYIHQNPLRLTLGTIQTLHLTSILNLLWPLSRNVQCDWYPSSSSAWKKQQRLSSSQQLPSVHIQADKWTRTRIQYAIYCWQ